ncbi:MAG: PQQ-like beta-propeller repeat protein [Deltaproteobacteria bacterium]|nr:PQQ-like beta-propeller repeat protein [Deltaproteobacteria bacterium]
MDKSVRDFTIGQNGDTYLAAFDAGILYSISPGGKLNWAFERPEIGRFDTPVVGGDGTIYLPTRLGLYALNADGSFKWVAEQEVQFRDVALGPKGEIVAVGVWDDDERTFKLYSIGPYGGTKWIYENDPDTIRINLWYPPTVDADGTIYIGDEVQMTQQGFLRAISADGTLKWRFGVYNYDYYVGVMIGPVSIGYCNRLYFVGNNVLCALGDEAPDGGMTECVYPDGGGGRDGGSDGGSDAGVEDNGADAAGVEEDVSDHGPDIGSTDVAPAADAGAGADTGVRDARYSTDSAAEVVVSAPGCGCAALGM